jgi:hypothetical protein
MPGPALFRKHPPTVHPLAGHVRPLPVRNPVRYAQTKIPRAYAARGTGKFLLIYSATAAFRASTRSVFSHFTPRSSRPMWP